MDVTDEQAKAAVLSQNQLLRMIARGEKLQVVLSALTEAVESLFPECSCRVLLAGEDARLELLEDRGCWHRSICAEDGVRLGTFAVECTEHASESSEHARELWELYRSIASIALEQDRRETKMRHSMLHDELTGLPNRAHLWDFLQAYAKQEADTNRLAALIVDVDRFRSINETLGHRIGDQILCQVALRLQLHMKQAVLVVRSSGDEFVVLWTGELTELEQLAFEFMRSFTAPLHIDAHSIHVTLSGGISYQRGTGVSPYDLIKEAETAMYMGKEQGRNQIQVYTEDMMKAIQHRHWLGEELQRATTFHEFSLVYQPKEHLSCGAITGVEALLRWHHPRCGAISPVEFIPVAEESGLIIAIGDWVLQAVCQQILQWSNLGIPPLQVAVNVSVRQFIQPDFLDKLRETIHSFGVDPARLQLEITETTLMEHTDTIQQRLLALRAMGIGVAIDDFGVAYSSLGYLQKFPVDVLKIDRSFVNGITLDRDAIVTSIISLAHKLQLRVVAEGVETDTQYQFLLEHGCDEMQGYLLARPMPSAELERFLRERAAIQGYPEVAVSSAHLQKWESAQEQVQKATEKLRDYEWLERCLTPVLDAEAVYTLMETVRHHFTERFAFDRFGILIGTLLDTSCVIHEIVTKEGLEACPAGSLMSVKDTGLEHIFTTKTVHYNPDILLNPEFTEDAYLSEIGLRSMVRIPLLHKDEVYGVMTVKIGEPSYYTEEDLALMGLVAKRISAALYSLKLIYSLREASFHDALTGIWNRRFMAQLSRLDGQDLVGEMSGISFSEGENVGILFIDINQFKRFNDSYGHTSGDALLKQVAQSLADAVGEKGWAIRYGGDEFVAVVPQAEMADLYTIAGLLRLRLADLAGSLVRQISGVMRIIPSFSIGIDVGPWTAMEELICSADTRMYFDKEQQVIAFERQA